MLEKISKDEYAYDGRLWIDHINGTVVFTSGGVKILRVSHLREPIPDGVMIDIVALDNLTSYTPIQGEALDYTKRH